MIIFPAIDLKGGQVVRLAEGDMDRATIYGDDPAAQAMIFAEADLFDARGKEAARATASLTLNPVKAPVTPS